MISFSKMDKIAGLVILYNPDIGVVNNINSYIYYIDILFLIDNSEIPVDCYTTELKESCKILYIPQNRNIGIAKALNIGAEKAIEMGYKWLLTMDQDSCFTESMAMNYFSSFIKTKDLDGLAVLSPMHQTYEAIETHLTSEYHNPTVVMTSGNLLNLNIYKEIGKFNEDLFIDEVDHDYCLRARIKGYNIIQFKDIFLNHRLGNEMSITKRGKKIRILTHTPNRMYYITRNNLYIWKKYYRIFPEFVRERIHQYYKKVKNMIIYEDDRLKKCYNIIIGFIDFIRCNYGERSPMSSKSNKRNKIDL